MCSRRTLLLSAIALWGGPLAAQDSAAVLTRMETSLDSMRAASALRDSAAQRGIRTDTVVVGGLRIATSPQFRPMAQAAATEAWAVLRERFGASVAEPGAIPVVHFGGVRSVVPERPDVHALARGFAGEASEAVWRTQGVEVRAWMRGSLPTEKFSGAALADVAEEIVRTPARPGRPCFAGDIASCANAFGIGMGADTLAEWYDPSTWPRLATLVAGSLNPLEMAVRQRCMNQGEPEACRTILSPERVLLPVGFAGRQYLVQLALERGGAGAFGRLTAGEGTPFEARLAAAAGVPTDSLLALWISGIRAAAPRGPAAPRHELLLALGWSMLLLVVVTRSSRWR